MKSFSKVLLALLGSAAAQTTTVIEVVNPFFGNNPYDASVVNVNPTATTYAVYCQTNSTNYQCRNDPAGLVLTLVGGPSTVEVHVERPKSELYDLAHGELCLMGSVLMARGTSTAYIGTISGDQLDYHVVATQSGQTIKMADMVLSPVTNSDARVPLTITAGIEKLQAQATAAATTTTTTESSGAQTGPSATGTQASPTSTPNAAVSRAGQDALLAGLAGAAAVAAVMLI
ncbi:uncharacterized protein ColSpa_05817 [Colletotrichum spaethianum]|uniref:Uncharacterized protein n=1 Tax=Colletotrichum spaethianum TaxID=700344 RepID=A0AA37P666_9PEZI|nr:uncharacterized protein ColSpa_05817 [Colletotrichum spaethianum]GKT45636.1 hypothetical protein ColSpa_05817 [Colletotrichum spaethianum]